MPSRDAWPKVIICLCLAGLAMAWLGSETLRLKADDPTGTLIDTVALALGGTAFMLGFLILGRHFRSLRDFTPPGDGATADGANDANRIGAGALAAALRVISEPAVVIGERGGIHHLNRAAVVFLDPTGLGRFSSLAEILDLGDLTRALVAARGSGTAARATIRLKSGGDVVVRVTDMGLRAGAVVVFEVPPDGPSPMAPRPGGRWGAAVDPNLPVASAPLLALSVHNDPATGHTHVATVKLTGGRVFATLSLDFVVGEGPGARPLTDVWPELTRAISGMVVVAQNADRVWDGLAAARRQAGFAEIEPPPMIDLARLAASVDPAFADASLDQLAARLDIDQADPIRRLAAVAAKLALATKDGEPTPIAALMVENAEPGLADGARIG